MWFEILTKTHWSNTKVEEGCVEKTELRFMPAIENSRWRLVLLNGHIFVIHPWLKYLNVSSLVCGSVTSVYFNHSYRPTRRKPCAENANQRDVKNFSPRLFLLQGVWLAGRGRWVCARRSLALDGTMWCHSRRGHMVRSSTRDSCTNQSECRSTQEEGGATESCAKSVRRGQGSIQDRRGNRQLQIHTGRGRDQRTRPPIAKMSTQVQRGRGDARRGMGLQTGSAEAKRAAATSVRSICNLFIWISSGALTRGARSPPRTGHAKKWTTCAHGAAEHSG